MHSLSMPDIKPIWIILLHVETVAPQFVTGIDVGYHKLDPLMLSRSAIHVAAGFVDLAFM